MPVCRLIFRLDFEVNFKIIDQPGRVMRTLWDKFVNENQQGVELIENKNNRTIKVRFVSENKDFMKDFTVEPKSVYGEFERVDGVEINKLLNDSKGFIFLSKLASSLCEEYDISDIKRSGLRLFYFNKLGHQDSDLVGSYKKMFNTKVIDKLENKLGAVQDYAVVLDGMSDDEIYYHFKMGPYRSEETQKFLSNLKVKNFSEQTKYNMICDLDLYELNFSLSNRTLLRLYRPVIAKAQSVIETLEKEIMNNMEEQ